MISLVPARCLREGPEALFTRDMTANPVRADWYSNCTHTERIRRIDGKVRPA